MDMTRDDIIAQARDIMGIASSKGSLPDTELQKHLNRVIERFCLVSEALQTVFNLDILAGVKYVPLPDEVLWVKSVVYQPLTGMRYQLSVLEMQAMPGLVGDPISCWLTAVNVPDVNGRSTPSLGIDPVPAVDMLGSLQCECFQVAQPLASGADVPELVSTFHQYLAWGLVLDWIPTHKDKAWLAPMATGRWQEGIQMFKRMCSAEHKAPKGGKQVLPYRQLARARW